MKRMDLRRRKVQPLRFVHYRTWTFNIAAPACAPGVSAPEKAKRRKYITTSDRNKVTCGQCKVRMGWLKEDAE